MRNNLALPLVTALMISAACTNKPQTWKLSKTISLEKINPIGLTSTDEGLWLSDGDRNRLVLVDPEGILIRTIDSLERPMHIDSEGNTLFVPLYGNDIIAKISKKVILALPIADTLDAPAGISVQGKEIAIADFYNHRILFSRDGREFKPYGTEGKAEGQFYYPTDVQITAGGIWVADAYNNRVQVFDKEGNFLRVIGADQMINAATGLFVTEQEVFVTDFENNRVLVFDHDGKIKQILTEGIDKPTDVFLYHGELIIANYKSGNLLVMSKS